MNLHAVGNLVAAAQRHEIGRFVHVSTVLTILPHNTRPLTMYERTKLAGERLAEQCEVATIVHPCRVYGPGPLNDANGATKVIAAYLAGLATGPVSRSRNCQVGAIRPVSIILGTMPNSSSRSSVGGWNVEPRSSITGSGSAPRQDPDGAYAAVIPRWIASMLRGEEVRINGSGETSRDFCFATGIWLADHSDLGILVAFVARNNPLAIVPVAVLLGGIRASSGLLQRAHELPDATVLVMQGIIFLVILFSETLYGRFSRLQKQGAS